MDVGQYNVGEAENTLKVHRIHPRGRRPAQAALRSPSSAVTVISPEDEQKGEKVYLYTHLRQQPIW